MNKDFLIKQDEKTSTFTLIYKNAIKKLLNNLISERNNEKIYTLIGFCYKKTHKYNKAISYFEKAIMLNQNYFSPYYQMGLCALKINKNGGIGSLKYGNEEIIKLIREICQEMGINGGIN